MDKSTIIVGNSDSVLSNCQSKQTETQRGLDHNVADRAPSQHNTSSSRGFESAHGKPDEMAQLWGHKTSLSKFKRQVKDTSMFSDEIEIRYQKQKDSWKTDNTDNTPQGSERK